MTIPPESFCLVTGATASRSVGYACAEALIRAGASKLTVMGRDRASVDAAVENLSKVAEQSTIFGVVGDLKKPETMKEVITGAVEKMGGLTILVVSGGNGKSEYLGLDAADPASYRMMNDVGVLSPLFLTEAAAPELAKSSARGGGTVVMISSMAPSVPWPDTAPFNYAKAAQNNMTETLAFKYRTGNIRVNAVLPSCIHTEALDIMAIKKNIAIDEYAKLRADAHPMARNGTPEDVANAVVFLASPASGYTTGELLKVDGGLHLSSWFNRPKILDSFIGGTHSPKLG
jgi:7-alpha-hydroxysteroid dehydrogenase